MKYFLSNLAVLNFLVHSHCLFEYKLYPYITRKLWIDLLVVLNHNTIKVRYYCERYHKNNITIKIVNAYCFEPITGPKGGGPILSLDSSTKALSVM